MKGQTTLTISTILGRQEITGDRGPFLLASVQGIEGISIPFTYDLLLYRAMDADDIDPSTLINTGATIGILKEGQVYVTRRGVFESFEKLGTTEQSNEARTDFCIYRARLVPAIKMLNYEQVFRVFEDMTVLEIVHEVLSFTANINPGHYVIRHFTQHDQFPKIDYCVQFNETTFSFISRLFAEFGIWYFFEHPPGDDPGSVEQMVVGRTPFGFKECGQPDMRLTSDQPDADKIADFRRGYQVAHRKVRVGDYNVLVPKKPVLTEATIVGQYDMVPGDDFNGTRFKRQAFPSGMPQADPNGDAHALDTDVRVNLGNEEARVFIAQGQTKNRTFQPGVVFKIATDNRRKPNPFGQPADGKYLITRLAISAHEYSYGHDFGSDFLNFINPLHWWQITTNNQKQPGIDVAAAVSGASLTQWLQDETKHIVNGEDINHFSSGLSGVSGAVGNVVQILGTEIKDIIASHNDDFANSFVAVPFEPGMFAKVPLPLCEPARANGPQLAVVIGPEGTEGRGQDVFTDALGRVRVRFPWHEELPEGGETNPWKTDRRTAWVRVSHAWAGTGMGTQFLPRIGDEVVVSYIDGDPARPVVTGRLYNASGGSPGLPFAANREPPKPVKPEYVHKPDSSGGAVGPNDQTLRSGIRTRSTPKANGAKDRFHMLRFDDKWHDEQLLLRSQARTDFTSFGPWYETSHGDRHVLIGGKDPDTGKGGGALLTTTGGEYDLHAGKDRYEGVDATYQLSVKGNTAFDLQADHATIVGGTATLNAKSVVIEASQKITLKVGGNFVVVDPCGVFINGTMVQINSGGSAGSTSDVELTDPLDAATADPGDPPNWLALHPPRGGGGRRHHTAHARHGLICTANPDGTIQVTKGIRVDAKDPAYADAVISQLALIDSTPTGQGIIGRIDSSGHSTLIQPADPPYDPPNADATQDNLVASRKPGTPGTTDAAGNPLPGAGTGSNSTLHYNPDQWPAASNDPDNPPGDVVLAHELSHADHQANGQEDDTPRADGFGDNEEFSAIQQESAYRKDRGLPGQRDHH